MDVTVIGAGPAGSVCAGLLARAGLEVVLTEAGPRSRPRPAEILPPPALRVMRSIQALPSLDRLAAVPCRGVLSRWAHRRPSFFDYELFGCEAALSVDRNRLDAELLALARDEGVAVAEGHRVSRVTRGRRESEWIVQADTSAGPRTWSTGFVVHATGRGGPRSREAVPGQSHDRLVALAAWTQAVPRQPDVLLLEAARHGWWYVSRYDRGPTWVVLLTHADLVPRGIERRAEWLQAAYERTGLIRHELDTSPRWGAHRGLDARPARASAFVGEGWLVVGDAAWSNDPLSGSGVLLAVTSARRAAEAIATHRRTGDVGGLVDFDHWCVSEHQAMCRKRRETYASVRPALRSRPFWAAGSMDGATGRGDSRDST